MSPPAALEQLVHQARLGGDRRARLERAAARAAGSRRRPRCAGMNCAMPCAPASERAEASNPLSASSCAASSAGGSCSARAAAPTSGAERRRHLGRHGELAAARAGRRARRQQPPGAVQPPSRERLDVHARAAVRRLDGQTRGDDEADVMRRRRRRTRDRRAAARPARQGPGELLQAGRGQPPDREAGRREARSRPGPSSRNRPPRGSRRPTRTASRAARAPRRRPRRRRSRPRTSARRKPGAGGSAVRRRDPLARCGRPAPQRDTHAHRDRRRVARPTLELDRDAASTPSRAAALGGRARSALRSRARPLAGRPASTASP